MNLVFLVTGDHNVMYFISDLMLKFDSPGPKGFRRDKLSSKEDLMTEMCQLFE